MLESRELLSGVLPTSGTTSAPAFVGPIAPGSPPPTVGIGAAASSARSAGVTFTPGPAALPAAPPVAAPTPPVVAPGPAPAPSWSLLPSPIASGLPVPLTEMVEPYKGAEPGLYGGGLNVPPPEHQAMADQALARIQPLNRSGEPAPDGRIGMVLIGPSTTMIQGQVFRRVAHQDPNVSPHVRIVNAGQNGMVAQSWAGSMGPWARLRMAMAINGINRLQVQAVWLKAAHLFPQDAGAFPAHAERYADLLTTIIHRAHSFFPNLQVVYLSSEVNFSFMRTGTVPEPFNYEGAFGVRSAIQRQMAGHASLNADPARGPVAAPVLLWGPYLWARTDVPRSDGLIWARQDFHPDGVHPSPFGSAKVGSQLHRFLLEDPNARGWYLRNP
jgi:hypothetical protein